MMGETGVGLLWCHPAQVVAEGDRLIERGKGAKADASPQRWQAAEQDARRRWHAFTLVAVSALTSDHPRRAGAIAASAPTRSPSTGARTPGRAADGDAVAGVLRPARTLTSTQSGPGWARANCPDAGPRAVRGRRARPLAWCWSRARFKRTFDSPERVVELQLRYGIEQPIQQRLQGPAHLRERARFGLCHREQRRTAVRRVGRRLLSPEASRRSTGLLAAPGVIRRRAAMSLNRHLRR